jgi:integrase
MDIRCPISPQSTRFLDRLRNFIRLRGLAYKTEKPMCSGSSALSGVSRLPVVFSPDEARRVIDNLKGEFKLVAMLIYGAGLRINEALRLRVKDVDFGMQQLIVCEGKLTRPFRIPSYSVVFGGYECG